MCDEGLLKLSESEWNEARRRTEIIRPLAAMDFVSRSVADEAARQLGQSRRQVYLLLRRYRAGSGLLTDLAPRQSNGGKGKGRLQPEIEAIVASSIEKFYLAKQRPSEAALVREIARRCRQNGYRPPARNSIRKRIDSVGLRVIVRKRDGSNAARALQAIAASTLVPDGPLDFVQIDHTKVDLIVVEEQLREPIGRPFVTLAIDVYTRCIVGMLLTLESPSATSVGLCLATVVADKKHWLEQLGLNDVSWPMHGKPRTICSDNAPEFKSEALRRGCEQHGIKLEYRPKGQPHFGGIIERVIGTVMARVHELPGTTFSNSGDRGTYDAQGTAILTLRELQQWFVLAICTYHEAVHGTLWEPPVAVWKRSATNKIMTISDQKAFLVDFLPVIRRRLGRAGFVIDHIVYFADVLKPWISERKRLDKFMIRRDPRDLSRIWVLDPASSQYLEIPYRSISNPAVTLWEHLQAIKLLKQRGQAQVDEAAIFRMIDQMREITVLAAQEGKTARRNQARRRHLSKRSSGNLHIPVPTSGEAKLVGRIDRFDDIEQW